MGSFYFVLNIIIADICTNISHKHTYAQWHVNAHAHTQTQIYLFDIRVIHISYYLDHSSFFCLFVFKSVYIKLNTYLKWKKKSQNLSVYTIAPVFIDCQLWAYRHIPLILLTVLFEIDELTFRIFSGISFFSFPFWYIYDFEMWVYFTDLHRQCSGLGEPIPKVAAVYT